MVNSYDHNELCDGDIFHIFSMINIMLIINIMQSNNHLSLFYHPKKIFQKYSILMKIHSINYTKHIYCARIKMNWQTTLIMTMTITLTIQEVDWDHNFLKQYRLFTFKKDV